MNIFKIFYRWKKLEINKYKRIINNWFNFNFFRAMCDIYIVLVIRLFYNLKITNLDKQISITSNVYKYNNEIFNYR